MESIEEQWDPPSSLDILSDSWTNISDAKKAVKIWILDRGESWAPSNQSNKIRLQLHCLFSTCAFYIRVGRNKDDSFGVTSYIPHNCPPSTHTEREIPISEEDEAIKEADHFSIFFRVGVSVAALACSMYIIARRQQG
jgi:hypothetical protein